jgi:hypothetical protein
MTESKKKKKKIDNKQPYQTIKTSLKSILRDNQTIQPQLNSLVIKCNDIVIQTYQFIRLYVLDKYNKKEELPNIDDKFILYCIKTQGIRDNRGKQAKDTKLLKELDDFYEKEYKPLLTNKEKINLKNLSFLLPYLAISINTSIQNNIKERFLQHLLRFINVTTKDLTEDKTMKFKLKTAILNRKEIPKEFTKWYNKYKDGILPKEIKKSVHYDIKAYPNKFLKCMFYMNSILEKEEAKLFQPLPLRNNIVPKYITIDTACLINLFAKKGDKGNLLSQVKENKGYIWNQVFNLDKKVFKSNNYCFNYQLETDGIGVSLSFIREDLKDKKYGTKTGKVKEESFKYINDYNDEELKEFENKNIVGLDPGKKFMAYMMDEDGKKLKYSASQRKIESMAKRNNRILLTEKKKNKVIDKETKLSEQNSKTIDYKKFKKYLKDKNKLNDKLKNFYQKDVWRKMKWRQFVYSKKSEDKFLNKIEDIFGKNIIIAYGDWSRTSQMKHFMPTKNKGLRTLIEKKYKTVSINEYNTSKNCCKCYNKLEYMKHNGEKTFRHLCCHKCLSSENKKTAFKTRDANSAINIMNLFKYYCKNKGRPLEFCMPIRSSSSNTIKNGKSKVEQSVDFTVVKTTKPN